MEPHSTLGVLREMWCMQLGSSPSVAFFSSNNTYLRDEITIAEAIRSYSGGRVLELQAKLQASYFIQVLGFEDTRTLFDVAPELTPAAVRNDIARALGIFQDDFLIKYKDSVLDQDVPFRDQDISEHELLEIDLRVTVMLRSEGEEECKKSEWLGSNSIGDLRQKLNLTDDQVIVAISPYRRILSETLRICHIVESHYAFIVPIQLVVEHKVFLSFEPIGLEHLRQKLLVPLSAAPQDLFDLISTCFQLSIEHRLVVNGQSLDNYRPLIEQLIDCDDVIQIDILRRCYITDLWDDIIPEAEQVYLYSTQRSAHLFGRDIAKQRLFYDNIQLTIFGSVMDVFGSVTGEHDSPLLIERDTEREFSFLTFDTIQRRLGWAQDLFCNVSPIKSSPKPKEVMFLGEILPSYRQLRDLGLPDSALLTVDPLKIVVKNGKRLKIQRFAPESAIRDVNAKLRLSFGDPSFEVYFEKCHRNYALTDPIDRRIARELFLLESASRYEISLST